MATYTYNENATGVRLFFIRKPSSAIRNHLKEEGWRWNHTMKYWYHWWSQEHEETAKEICRQV